jgi:hypothetical protein
LRLEAFDSPVMIAFVSLLGIGVSNDRTVHCQSD